MSADTTSPPPPTPGFAEEDIDTLRMLLQSILTSVPDAMVVINEAGSIMAFSAEAERMFGYTCDEVRGKNVNILMAAKDHTYHDRYIRNYLKTGEKQIIGVGRIVTAQRADGSTLPIELKIGEANMGEHRLFTGFLRDLSDQRAYEHRLNQLQIELTNFSRLSAVGTMASAMAHELNQPLTAVANYLEAARDLLQTPDPETVSTVQEALNLASTQSIRAGQIIRRLRDYVSRGEIETQPVDIGKVITEAASLAKIGIEGQLARIIERVDDGIPKVLADRLQIRQVIVNLVKNAIEALQDTENPQIWLSAHQVDDDWVEVEVKDNGPGFSFPDGHGPFDAFNSSKPDGMGLGLSICQTIIDAHGSEIVADSRPGEGAVFRFRLKVDTTQSQDD